MVSNDLIKSMQSGDISSINVGLNHNGAIYRINGIINAVRNNITDNSIIDKIDSLCNDDIAVDMYSVSEFATAAMVILGNKKYTGDNKHIEELIKSKMNF